MVIQNLTFVLWGSLIMMMHDLASWFPKPIFHPNPPFSAPHPTPLPVSFSAGLHLNLYPRFSAATKLSHAMCDDDRINEKFYNNCRAFFFIIFSFFFIWFGCFEFQRLLVLSAPRNSRRLNVIVVVVVAAGSRVVVDCCRCCCCFCIVVAVTVAGGL